MPRVRHLLPGKTVRLRLTLVYGGLFLLSGAALLAIIYALVVHNTTGFIFTSQDGGFNTSVVDTRDGRPKGAPEVSGRSRSGEAAPGEDAATPEQLLEEARRAQAQARNARNDVLDQLLAQSGVALGAMVIVSMLLGWIVAGRMLRPLRTITGAARDISATNLHERLALAGPSDELKELGDTFDALLARLEASFESQRRFIANASHELRTPLTRQRTLAQVAISDPEATVASLRAAHQRVLASGAQQERLIDGLLTLARGEAGVAERAPLDLGKIAEDALQARERESREMDLEVHATLDAAPAEGDPRLVERLVANLVDNAIRHNVHGGGVQVDTTTEAGRGVLSVVNTGQLVPDEAIERLVQPFERLAAHRHAHGTGVGLGLSIVEAIASAHDAHLVVLPGPEGGLRVEVTFPKPTAQPVRSSI